MVLQERPSRRLGGEGTFGCPGGSRGGGGGNAAPGPPVHVPFSEANLGGTKRHATVRDDLFRRECPPKVVHERGAISSILLEPPTEVQHHPRLRDSVSVSAWRRQTPVSRAASRIRLAARWPAPGCRPRDPSELRESPQPQPRGSALGQERPRVSYLFLSDRGELSYRAGCSMLQESRPLARDLVHEHISGMSSATSPHV